MDIEAMTLASQRVQIALYKLQMQDGAVARAMQRLDGARDKCIRTENDRQHVTANIQQIENALASGSMPDSQTKELQRRLADLKVMLDTQTAEAQACQTAEVEASGQLQKEQGQLNGSGGGHICWT